MTGAPAQPVMDASAAQQAPVTSLFRGEDLRQSLMGNYQQLGILPIHPHDRIWPYGTENRDASYLFFDPDPSARPVVREPQAQAGEQEQSEREVATP